MNIASTARLNIRHFTLDDAPFVLELVNDPDWLRYIGDRNAHSIDDARAYAQRAIDSYTRQGFGLYVVESRDSRGAIGIAGFVRRDGLNAPDLGFAFLATARGNGFALEACRALLQAAPMLPGLVPREGSPSPEHGSQGDIATRIFAVATEDNSASIRLLEKLGFQRMGDVRLPNTNAPLLLFSTGLNPVQSAATPPQL
jgi:ribosomal-protein-alanine N-acetyltransferase